MATTEQLLHDFFEQYAKRMNKAIGDEAAVDVESIAASFADFFIEANPYGVNGGRNDANFRAMIPKGLEFYRSVGTKSMTIAEREITQLDQFHWMVHVYWEARYEKRDGSGDVIPFEVIYFVQVMNDTPKIFAYITGDEQAAYREHGLIPEEAAQT